MKTRILLLVYTFINLVSFAQNASCPGSTLTVGSSCSTTNFSITTNNSEGTGLTTCATAGGDYYDGWYQFTATSTSTTIDLSGLNIAAAVSIYNSCPTAPGSYITCQYLTAGVGNFILTTTIGNTYQIRIQRRGGNNKADLSGQICVFNTPVAPGNNDCSTPTTLTPASAGSGTCTTTNGTTYGATASVQTVCGGQADDDVWYTFQANSTSHQVTVDGIIGFNAQIEVFSGTCGGTMTSMACLNTTGDGGVETANLTGLTVGSFYLVRVYHSLAGYGSTNAASFTICVTSTAPPCNIGAAGTNATVTLPLAATSYTTCGMGNDITSSNASSICGSSSYYGGEDKVIIFTPTASGNININLTSTGSWVGMMLYQGCPTGGGTCVAYAQGSAGNQSIGCASVVASQTYYLVVDSYPSPTCNPFTLTISAPSGGIPAGTTCSNAVAMTLPYTATGQSTLCYGNDYTNASTGSCGTLYESGEDKVYAFTTTGPDCLSLSLTNASTSYIGYQVYAGCPGTAGTTCISNGGGATSGSLSGSFTVPSAGTYYVVVDTWASPSYVNYDIQLVSLGGTPANDLPCGAIAMGQPAGLTAVSASGDNNCTGGSGEPAAPGGWTTGNVNSVWFTVTVPASGSFIVKTIAGSLTNTQIAAYYGTCGAGMTFISSNNDIGYCGSSTNYASQLTIGPNAAYPAGSLVYIRVDGESNATGTFSIMAVDATASFPGVQGQDCSQPNPVCQSTISVSNPGYSGNGNNCDINSSSYCLASGERNVVWYRVPILTGGNLNFNIVPNDFVSATESETDYDFAVWKTNSTTSGEVLGTDFFNCAQIAAGTAPPEVCNYSYLGVTGVGTGGNAPSSFSGTVCPQCGGGYNPSGTYSAAYEPTIVAAAGDEYLIAVSNFSNSTSGFRIEFLTGAGAAVINYAAATATAEVYWTGGDAAVPTEVNDVDNWGGCSSPTCSIDAFVSAVANEPIVAAGTTRAVRDITIQPGAMFTLQANSILQVCGNFTNYGTLIADPTSTIVFMGTGTQNVIGALTGTSKFGNLTVTKSTGTVVLNNDIEIAGTFTTSNSTSIFNSNGKYVSLGKHFSNATGNTTYTNTGTTGTLEFNGSGLQTYNQGSSQLDLNFVIVNNTAGLGNGVTLATNMFIKATTGTLTLNVGTITTTGTSTTTGFKVHVLNTAVGSVSVGNTASFVDGNLRRYLSGTGIYNWPVGNVAKGYQRALTNFSSNANPYVDARFDVWPGTLPIQGGSDCGTSFTLDAMNNGYWTLVGNGSAATYNMSLFPLNVTNAAAGWTIMKQQTYNLTGWLLNGVCAASTVSQINRNSMTNFSVFGIAQAPTPLPMELIEFSGQIVGEDNLLTWTTASEINNDYFTLERSRNGYDFEILAVVDGAGTSTSTLNYDQFDFDPFQGVSYYRLKQTDFNGQYSYSQTIALNRGLESVLLSELYPNPATQMVSFEIATPKSSSVIVEMFDNTGRLISSNNYEAQNGTNSYSMDISGLARGVYTVVFRSELFEKAEIKQLIKN